MADNLNTTYLSDGTTTFSNISLAKAFIGGASTPVTLVSRVTVGVVAITAAATKSTETTFALSGATTGGGDFILISAPSALSEGLAFNAYVSDADTGTLRFSNVSTVAAAQTAQTWGFTLMRIG